MNRAYPVILVRLGISVGVFVCTGGDFRFIRGRGFDAIFLRFNFNLVARADVQGLPAEPATAGGQRVKLFHLRGIV